MDKLTLSVDPGVVLQAKRYAAVRGTSVSRLVENMLRMLSVEPSPAGSAPPILTKLRGSIKRGGVEQYRRHLERKYR